MKQPLPLRRLKCSGEDDDRILMMMIGEKKNKYHLLSTYYVPGTVLNALRVILSQSHNNPKDGELKKHCSDFV